MVADWIFRRDQQGQCARLALPDPFNQLGDSRIRFQFLPIIGRKHLKVFRAMTKGFPNLG